MAIVYTHRRNDTGEVFYVGIGRDEKRAYAKSKADRTNNHWFNIVNKYGYTVEITHRDIIWEEACAIERYLIVFYGRRDLETGTLVNLTDGGDGTLGQKHSEETKALFKLQTNTPERKKLSSDNFKLAHTKEAREKARKNRDYKHIGNVQKKIVYQYDLEGNFIREWPSAKDAAKELNLNYESINNNSRGKSSSAGGFMWKYEFFDTIPVYTNKMKTEEYRNKCGQAVKRAVIQLDYNGKILNEFDSTTSAANYVNTKPSCISACCRNRSKTSMGFVWKYKSEII